MSETAYPSAVQRTWPTLRKIGCMRSWSARRVRTILVVWWILLFAAMHAPKPQGISPPFRFFDKCVHLVGYGVLAGLCAWSTSARGRFMNVRQYMTWWVLLAIYGIVDELLQPLVGRTCDYRDWLTDMAGVVLGLTVFHFMSRPGMPSGET